MVYTKEEMSTIMKSCKNILEVKKTAHTLRLIMMWEGKNDIELLSFLRESSVLMFNKLL